MTAPDSLPPFSPAWYAWHEAHPTVTRYDRIMGAIVNGTIGTFAALLTGRRA